MDQLKLEDEDEWAKQQGVPSFEEPFIQKYLQGRDALIAQEKRQRSGQSKSRVKSYQFLLTLVGRPCFPGNVVPNGSRSMCYCLANPV